VYVLQTKRTGCELIFEEADYQMVLISQHCEFIPDFKLLLCFECCMLSSG